MPATSLKDHCYAYMFQGCKALTTAPDLPATTLVSVCYEFMFDSCSLLSSIKIGYTGDYNGDYFDKWVDGVASSGTFYYNGNQSPDDFGLWGWTKQSF